MNNKKAVPVRYDGEKTKKEGSNVYPMIDKRLTGQNLKFWMDKCCLTVKDVQHYLYLGSPQSVYQWLSGRTLPTLDNLYALSELFQAPLDELICGSRKKR